MARVTKTELKSYIRWNRTIARHQKSLVNGELDTVDSVTGSSNDFPYLEQTITIEGCDVKREAHLKTKMSNLADKCKRIEAYIENVKDDELRDILRLKYIMGYSWPKVARKMRCGVSADAARMRVERFLKKNC